MVEYPYLGAHGRIGWTSMEIHGCVVESVAASFVIGAVTFVAMKRFFAVDWDAVHDDNVDEKGKKEEDEEVTS